MSKYKQRGAYHYDEYRDKMSIYHQHVNKMLQFISNYTMPESRILDVGCGEGLFVGKLRDRGFNILGVDIDETAVRLAQTFGHPVTQGTIEDFALERYDAILFLDVLEHVTDLHGALECAEQMTNRIIVAVPDRHDPHAVRQDCAEEVRKILDGLGFELIDSYVAHSRNVGAYEKQIIEVVDPPAPPTE